MKFYFCLFLLFQISNGNPLPEENAINVSQVAEIQDQATPEVQAETKVDIKADTKADAETDVKAEVKAETQADAKAETEADSKDEPGDQAPANFAEVTELIEEEDDFPSILIIDVIDDIHTHSKDQLPKDKYDELFYSVGPFVGGLVGAMGHFMQAFFNCLSPNIITCDEC